jgi:hypothetical protein
MCTDVRHNVDSPTGFFCFFCSLSFSPKNKKKRERRKEKKKRKKESARDIPKDQVSRWREGPGAKKTRSGISKALKVEDRERQRIGRNGKALVPPQFSADTDQFWQQNT